MSIVPAHSTQAEIFEPGFEVETIAGGFVLPTSMAFAQDGRIFVAEKGGTVRVIKNGAVLPAPVITLTDINTFGDRGLIGIATDPNFSSNGYLYLSYTYENSPGSNFGGPKTGRIVRVTVVGDVADEASKVVLVGTVGGTPDLPSCEDYPIESDCIPSDSMSHSVGGLRFGPDGKLYATLGDGSNFDAVDPRALRAQNIDSLAGKVLRINTDGTGISTNPFYNGDINSNRSRVYAYGVRNAFRFNFNPTDGSFFLGDVGWSTWEEINYVSAGNNFGWPCHEGMGTTLYSCTASSAVTDPLHAYAHDINGAGSVTGGSFPANSAYPSQYDTSYFFGDYAQNWIKRLVVDASNSVVSVNNFMDDSGAVTPNGPVDIATGLDGNIYYLSIYTGELNRITHTTGNRHPVAVIGANPTSGLTPLMVSFSSAGSNDPDGDDITFLWNFGDGATSNEANPSHEYATNGTYNAVLTLTDIYGAMASKSITINAGNQKPNLDIVSPLSGSLYLPNQVIQLSGVATDPEDGVLSEGAFHWEIILHHNIHTHTLETFDATTSPSFLGPDHGSDDVYVEVKLTVTDSGGLSNSRSINLYLNSGIGSGNLISNPSMEVEDGIPGTPFRWFKGGYGVNNPVFTYPVSGFDGVKAAQLEVTSYSDGNAKWYFDPVFVTPGAVYDFSNYYTANATTLQVAQFGFSNGTYQYQFLGEFPAAISPTLVAHQITIPAGAETLTVFHELDQVGILTVDNYSLVLGTSSADVVAPTVFVSAPSEGSTVSSTSLVSINATDNVNIAGVSFFVDGAMIGAEDTSIPYEFVWDTTAFTNGAHTLSASARDSAGNVATSTAVNVVVNNGGTIVNLIQNGTLEVTEGNEPLGWNPSTWGNHTAVHTYPVVGHDGGKAARTEITNYPANGTGDAKWYFDKIAITPGTVYTYKDHYRSNTISDIIGQYTLQNGTFHYFGLAKEIQPTANWQTITATFTPPSTATHVTFFHLISAVGFVEIDDVEMYETGTGTPSETNVPVVEFLNPLQGQTISGTVALSASSSDDTAVTYIFYAVDGIPITGQITQPPYEFNWDTNTVSNGQHVLKATTHDPSGNNSTHEITVAVNNVATSSGPNLIANPSLETAGPTGDPTSWIKGGWGTNTRTHTYPVAGTHGTDAAKVEITSYTNGDAKWYFADVPVTSGGIYTFTHSYRANTITNLTARYTRSDGTVQYIGIANLPASSVWANTSYSLTIPANVVSMTIFHAVFSVGWVEVDNYSLISAVTDTVAPVVSITAPANGSAVSGNVNVSANATDSVGVVGVSLLVDGVVVGAEDTSSPYDFTWDTTIVTNGSHTLSARARDAVGNIATSTGVVVTVSNSVPTSSNLILNPSLETAAPSGDPQDWFRGGWGTNTRTYTYPVAGTHGADAAKVEMTSFTNGDAKWYFKDVPVTSGEIYTFTHSYRANVPSNITARYTKTDGTFQYVGLRNLAVAATWTPVTETITIPAGVVSMTVFHSIFSVGWVEVDDYYLTSGNSSTFNRGMVSLTFDDGWLSHYQNALPILDAEGVDGTFFIVSQETLNAVPDERISNPSLETAGVSGDPENWFRGGWGTNTRTFTYPVASIYGSKSAKVEITSYTNGDAKWYFADATVIPNQKYIVSNSYNSNINSEVLVRYTLSGGGFQYAFLASLPSTSNTWQNFQQTITIPANAVSMTLFHVIAGVGSLTVDNYSLKRVQVFVDPAQMLALQASGHEIGTHTRTHTDLTTLTAPEQQTEIQGSRTEIIGMGATPVNTIAYPFGAYTAGIQTITQNAGYVAARGVDRGYNVKTTDKYALKIQQVNRTTTVSEVQAWTTQAALNKTWLILMFHQIDEDPSADLGTTPALLQQMVDVIKASDVDIVTMHDGVLQMNP